MKHILFTTLLLLGLAFTSYAQQATTTTKPPYNFTLQDCINYAYDHQDSVLNANLDIKSADYKVRETTGIGLPQISGSANFQDYVKIPVTLIPGQFFGGKEGQFVPVQFGVKYQSNLGLSLNQLLFDGSYLVG